jgi:6-phosphogluconolactonase
MAGDGSSVLCANYVSGNVTRFPLADDGSLLDGSTTALPKGSSYPGKVASRQDGAHAHCYHPLGSEFGLVCDLGTDQVVAFRIKDGEEVGRCKFPDGSGPRHVAVAADGKWAYASCELGNIVVAFEVDSSTGKLGSEPKCTLSPPDTSGDQNTPSHIDLSSCGRFAFIANRMGVPAADGSCANSTEGSITVVALQPGTENHLTFVETKYLEGKVPRGFCVVGRWLVAGLQESSFIKSFQIGEDGKLTDGHKLEIPSPGVVVAAKRRKLS